uniref:fibronectin type III domain-containing protein n=1 Tax=Parerythrobacter lutipelagi TaxID=1964208 RepID=UPI001F0029FC|nr:fibronectin type III domain-containing protein [Parerythrobacter lutipelagi]
MRSGQFNLTWRAVPGATYYDFGVRDIERNSLVVDRQSRSNSFRVSLREGRSYRWNIRACNNSGCSDYSDPLFFTVTGSTRPRPMPTRSTAPIPPVTPPPRPTATATRAPAPQPAARVSVPAIPRSGSPGRSRSPGDVLTDSNIRLRWSAVSGATEYDFGIRDMTTNRLVVDKRSTTTSFRTRLTAGRTYRWNVRACNSAGCSDFSSPLYFTIEQPRAAPPPATSTSSSSRNSGGQSNSGSTSRASSRPAMPTGMSPGYSASPGQRVRGTTVRISWDSVRGTEEYDYGIRDMTTGKLVVDRKSDRTSYTTRLESGHTYRWNVRACNSAGCSSFTVPRYFTVE